MGSVEVHIVGEAHVYDPRDVAKHAAKKALELKSQGKNVVLVVEGHTADPRKATREMLRLAGPSLPSYLKGLFAIRRGLGKPYREWASGRRYVQLIGTLAKYSKELSVPIRPMERKEMVRFARSIASGRVPTKQTVGWVKALTFLRDTLSALEIRAELKKQGADAAVVVCGFDHRPDRLLETGSADIALPEKRKQMLTRLLKAVEQKYGIKLDGPLIDRVEGAIRILQERGDRRLLVLLNKIIALPTYGDVGWIAERAISQSAEILTSAHAEFESAYNLVRAILHGKIGRSTLEDIKKALKDPAPFGKMYSPETRLLTARLITALVKSDPEHFYRALKGVKPNDIVAVAFLLRDLGKLVERNQRYIPSDWASRFKVPSCS